MSTGVAPAAPTTRQARLGSFAIVERLNSPDAPSGQISLRVAGLPGSAFEGREGVATCFPAPADDASRTRVEGLVTALKSLHHPALWPLIDAGVAGSIMYWIRSAPVVDSLASWKGEMSIRALGELVGSISEGLHVAHQRGLSHGSIRSSSILRYPSGAWALTGLGVMGQGPANDQYALALTAVNRIAARPWHEPDLSGYPEQERAYHRGQRLREHLSTTTERVVNVLNKAMHLDPTQRYPDIAQFGADLVEQIRLSGEDLVHGAFEAISARNVELARVICDKAAAYNPDSENLAILRLQLNGGSVFGTGQPQSAGGGFPVASHEVAQIPIAGSYPVTESGEQATGSHGVSASLAPDSFPPGLVLPPMQSQTGSQAVSLPAELTQGLPPEFLQMIAPQFQQTPVRKGMNPIFILALGGIGVVLLMLIAALVTFVVSGS